MCLAKEKGREHSPALASYLRLQLAAGSVGRTFAFSPPSCDLAAPQKAWAAPQKALSALGAPQKAWAAPQNALAAPQTAASAAAPQKACCAEAPQNAAPWRNDAPNSLS